MYSAEQIFNSLTYEELYYTLKSIAGEDCMLGDFLDNESLEDFLYILDIHDLTYIASDERVLLTPKGEKVLQYVGKIVELDKFSHKIKLKY